MRKMRNSAKYIVGCLLGIVAALTTVQAAPPAKHPHIGYAYPAGGQRGSTVQVVVGGMNLMQISEGKMTGEGVKVVEVRQFRPFERLSNDARRELIPILRAMKEGKDPVKAYTAFATKRKKRLDRKNANDADKEDNKDDDAADIVPGERLVYIPMTPAEVVTKIKAMTPLEFGILYRMVTTRRNNLQAAPAIAQAAIVKIEIAADAPLGLRRLYLFGKLGLSNSVVFEVADRPEDMETLEIGKEDPPFRTIKVPSVVNGQIMPGEVDRLRFAAAAGTVYNFDVLGRNLVPFLGDAVPGWFQPIISVHDPKTGKEIAFADDHLFDPDPRLTFTAPAAGEYELRIRDSIYRGREDFVYRIHAYTGKPEDPTWINPKHAQLPETVEAEPNNHIAEAMTVKCPVLVSGQMQERDDCDTFAFQGKKGEAIVLEVLARRLNSPMDSVVKLLDAEGKVLAWNDDGPWPNIGIKTHHSDSFLMHTLPADGTYYAQVMGAQRKSGKDVRYSLQIRPAQPDFSVFLDPSTVNCPANGNTAVTLHVFRREGFKGAVDVSMMVGPADVRLDGGHFPAGVDKIRATISIPPKFPVEPRPFVLQATAEINGAQVMRHVVASDEIMQAFLWTHFVPAEKALLYPVRRNWISFASAPLQLKLTPGQQNSLVVRTSRPLAKALKKGNLKFELNAPPKGVELVSSKIRGRAVEFTFKTSADAPEWRGNLIVDVFIEQTRQKPNGKGRTHSASLGCLPAITTTIGKAQ